MPGIGAADRKHPAPDAAGAGPGPRRAGPATGAQVTGAGGPGGRRRDGQGPPVRAPPVKAGRSGPDRAEPRRGGCPRLGVLGCELVDDPRGGQHAADPGD